MAEERQVDERPFRVGARFPDFATFVRALKNYQKEKNVIFSVRYSRTVAAACKKGLKAISEDLKYSYVYVKYECKHARKYESQNSRKRPSQRY
jgi:hypothetical protein